MNTTRSIKIDLEQLEAVQAALSDWQTSQNLRRHPPSIAPGREADGKIRIDLLPAEFVDYIRVKGISFDFM